MHFLPLTKSKIIESKSDGELYDLLANELLRLIGPCTNSNINEFLSKLPSLNIGLRAMASVYDLDVSLARDDLGWHFMNRHSLKFAHETLAGLIELNTPHAEIFAEAITIVEKHWDFIGSPNFTQEYLDSELDQLLLPLNKRMWELQGDHKTPGKTILDYWASNARKFPEKIVLE